jgi:ABC-2 type transport system permease protein
MKPGTDAAVNTVVLPWFPSLGALASLFVLTLRQHRRGRRLLVLSLLFALPSALVAVVTLLSPRPPQPDEIKFAFVFNMIPHALAPLAALLYATGIIQDEVEEQTLTYLLLRPLPRWLLYIVKLVATLLMVSLLTTLFTTITFIVISLTRSEPVTSEVFSQAMQTSLVLALAQAGYCGLFGLLGLLMRRSLFVGVAYIFFFEGILASIDTVARKLTIMYYYRVLILRWLKPPSGSGDWSITLAKAPDAQTCVLMLLIVSAVLTLLGAIIFTVREFRMKTPEGN